MSSYQKFTPQTIKDNLKSGKYANATGANRAIGKTQELSEADKEKAKALVAKHFGVEPAKKAPVKKVSAKKAPAKKVAAKKAVAKKIVAKPVKVAKAPVAKKVAKKAPKKAAAKPVKEVAAKGRGKKTATKAAAEPKERATAAKRAPKSKAAQTADAAPVVQQASSLIEGASRKIDSKRTSTLKNTETIGYVGKIIESLHLAIKTMESARTSFPKVSFDEGVSTAQSAMTKAVALLRRDVLGGEDTTANASTTPPAAKTSAKKVQKTKGGAAASPKNGKGKSRQINGVTIDQDLWDDSNASDEDKLSTQLAREHRPANETATSGNTAEA